MDAWSQFPDAPQTAAPHTAGGGDPWAQFPDAGGAVSAPKFTPPALSDAQIDDMGQDDAKVSAYINQFPEQHRDVVRNAWADALVAKERKGGTAQRVTDAVNRIASYIPTGSYADEIHAGMDYLTGNSYKNSLAYNRARQRAIENTETDKLGTLPLIGDVYTSGLEKLAGGLLGGVAAPQAKIMQGSGFVPGAVNAGVNTAGYSALQGFGEGEGTQDRIQNALVSGGEGAALGGALGGSLSKVARQFEKGAPTARDEAVAAAERLKTSQAPDAESVRLPEFVATDSNAMRSTAGGLASQPLTGGIIRDAAQNSANQLGQAVTKIADDYSSQGTRATFGTPDSTAAANAAGNELRDSLLGWSKGDSQNILGQKYDDILNKLPANARSSLPNTLQTVFKVITESQNAGTSSIIGDRIGRLMNQALFKNGSLGVEDIKNLRTAIGKMMDDTFLPGGGTIQPALKQIYGSLTDDIKRTIHKFGGNHLAAEWENTNQLARSFAQDREQIAGIIGASADATGETVVNRLAGMAGSNSRADIQSLLMARTRAKPEVWNELASAVVRRMGEGSGVNPGAPGQVTGFSPDRFMTAWNKLSQNGKDALFGSSASSSLRGALDDVATVSQKFKDLRQYQNPSGTAQASGWMTLLGEMWAGGPLLPIAQIAGTGVLSKIISQPASARAVSRWGNAVYNSITGQTGQAALKLATMNLAAEIAKQNGGDEREIAVKLQSTMRGAQ